MNLSAVAVGSSELAVALIPLMIVTTSSGFGSDVNRGEDAFAQYEAMCVAIRISILSCDLVCAIRIGCRAGRTGHVNRGKVKLSLRQPRDTQNQAQHNSRKCFP